MHNKTKPRLTFAHRDLQHVEAIRRALDTDLSASAIARFALAEVAARAVELPGDNRSLRRALQAVERPGNGAGR